MSIHFDQQSKIQAVATFISTMHTVAKCDAAELKQLMAPEVIDLVVQISTNKALEGENS